MAEVLQLLSGFSVAATLIPLSSHPHWIVRTFDFIKIQLAVLQLITLAFVMISGDWGPVHTASALCLVYNAGILLKYSPIYKVKIEQPRFRSDSLTLLSANVLQFNTDYERFVGMIQQTQPDIFLTMESNEDWDTGMLALESDYPYLCKIPLENTYGMHLYSKLPMTTKVHYFVAEDLPSIEAELQTSKGYRFTLFCVHPPPPSPTEEENSKERDGELLAVAKKIRESGRMSTVVVGDFNNVAWSRSSVLFRKLSETIDPRVGRSLTPTFHAKYWFARFPIDQLFHSTDIHIEELKTLPYFGSDHLPLYCKFSIGSDKEHQEEQEELLEELEEGELEEADELIAEGVEEEGDRDDVAT